MSKNKIILNIFSPNQQTSCRYWVMGNSKNPPIIFLSGYATSGCRDFIEIARLLSKSHYVVILEYPGWGESSKLNGPLTITNYAIYLRSLIRHLDLENVVLFGHCFGALVAIEYVYQYPHDVKRIIVSNTPFLDGLMIKKFYLALAKTAIYIPKRFRPAFYFWRSRILNVPLDLVVIKTSSFKKKLYRIKDHIINQSFHDEDAVEENWMSLIGYKFTKAKTISSPVHVLHGENDLLIGLGQTKKLFSLFPNASIDIIQQSGHVPLVESPGNLAHLITKYTSSYN